MPKSATILLLEDEPLILLDLELAALDHGCDALTATNCAGALRLVADNAAEIDVAVLDVSLANGTTCLPVAEELSRHDIPYILHSGNLDRHDENVRGLSAQLVPKPALSDQVISIALEQIGPN